MLSSYLSSGILNHSDQFGVTRMDLVFALPSLPRGYYHGRFQLRGSQLDVQTPRSTYLLTLLVWRPDYWWRLLALTRHCLNAGPFWGWKEGDPGLRGSQMPPPLWVFQYGGNLVQNRFPYCYALSPRGHGTSCKNGRRLRDILVI
jgi:hypothetical protein